MTAPRTALVVGGGIVGLSSALALQDRGLAVTLLDDAPERPPASWGNVGHIAVEQSDPLASIANILSLPRRLALFGGPASFPLEALGTWLPFGLRLMAASTPARFARGRAALTALLERALPAWQGRLGRLDRPDLLHLGGHVVAWESAASATAGRRAAARPAVVPVAPRDVAPPQMQLLRSIVSAPIVDAVRWEGTASVADPGAVLAALRAAFVAAGGRVRTVLADRATLRTSDAEVIVVAAGVRSRALMEELGHRVPIVAERGYHLQSASARWPAGLPPVIFEDRSIVVTGFTSGVRVTGYVEFTRHDAPPDEAKWARLARHLDELGLRFDGEVTKWHGSRPTLPDYLPAIGRSRAEPRVVYAFGHQHLGMTLGPVTGDLVAALALGEAAPIDLAPFAIERFGGRA